MQFHPLAEARSQFFHHAIHVVRITFRDEFTEVGELLERIHRVPLWVNDAKKEIECAHAQRRFARVDLSPVAVGLVRLGGSTFRCFWDSRSAASSSGVSRPAIV